MEVIMPPTIGAAIGFITSEPTPVSHRMGTRLARTTQTVINFGRSRCTAPSITAASMSSCFSGAPDLSRWSKRFVQIDDHDDAGFNRDAEQRDIADPHRDAEVVAEQPLENQTAGQRIDRGENQDGGLSDRMKDHVEQQEDHEEDDGQNQLQPLLWRAIRIRIRQTICR